MELYTIINNKPIYKTIRELGGIEALELPNNK